jgi:hypothetical protein
VLKVKSSSKTTCNVAKISRAVALKTKEEQSFDFIQE